MTFHTLFHNFFFLVSIDSLVINSLFLFVHKFISGFNNSDNDMEFNNQHIFGVAESYCVQSEQHPTNRFAAFIANGSKVCVISNYPREEEKMVN